MANAFTVTYDVGRAQSASGGPSSNTSISWNALSQLVQLNSAGDQFSALLHDSLDYTSNFVVENNSDNKNRSRFFISSSSFLDDEAGNLSSVAMGNFWRVRSDPTIGIDNFRVIDFIYGRPASTDAIPRAGDATYKFRVSGNRTSLMASSLVGLSGTGAAIIDFATGKMVIGGSTGSIGISDTDHGKFYGTGQLGSSDNSFSGNFSVSIGSTDSQSGSFTGKFFGPAADEVGGSMFAGTSLSSYSLTFAGRRMASVAATDTVQAARSWTRFETITVPVDLTRPDAAPPRSLESLDALSYAYKGTDSETSLYSLQFNYDPGDWNYLEFGTDNRTPDRDEPDFLAFGAAKAIDSGKRQYSINFFVGETAGIQLTYSRFVRIFGTDTNLAGEKIGQGFSYLGFGIGTPPSQLPRSGSAVYEGRLFGDVYNDTSVLASLVGQSNLTVNFETSALGVSLLPSRVEANGTLTPLSRLDFSGSLDAFMSSFKAALNSGTGTMSGRFYGDTGQEYVSAFSVDHPTQGFLVGVSIGKRTGP